jgi:RNA polymerase sigma factor
MLILIKNWLSQRGSRKRQQPDVFETVAKIQSGDKELANQFLNDYKPFVAKVTAKVCNRYIDAGSDDVFSVALEAFHEAIHKFSSNKGSSFWSFADLVIRRRLIDHIRREAKHANHLSLDYVEDDEQNDQSQAEIAASLARYEQEAEVALRREEIFHYREKLREFGIEFAKLPDLSPKHEDARQSMIEIGRKLASDESLRKQLIETKKIPVKPLLENVAVSRKTIERNRAYIIAIALIFIEDYQYLRNYLEMED